MGLKEPAAVWENDGPVEVCAAVLSPVGDCTVDFNFDVRLRTENNSAGTIH